MQDDFIKVNLLSLLVPVAGSHGSWWCPCCCWRPWCCSHSCCFCILVVAGAPFVDDVQLYCCWHFCLSSCLWLSKKLCSFWHPCFSCRLIVDDFDFLAETWVAASVVWLCTSILLTRIHPARPYMTAAGAKLTLWYWHSRNKCRNYDKKLVRHRHFGQ